jgi:hypothetical protein
MKRILGLLINRNNSKENENKFQKNLENSQEGLDNT